MVKTFNPEDIVKPASNYVQGVSHRPGAERLIISGQVGIAPDGRIETGMEAQMVRCWTNMFAVLRAAGFDKQHIAKVTVFVTEPGATALYREVRDRMLEGHRCAATYLQVAGLANPDLKVEIEAEAIKD